MLFLDGTDGAWYDETKEMSGKEYDEIQPVRSK